MLLQPGVINRGTIALNRKVYSTAQRMYATRCDMPVNAIAGMLGGTARLSHKNRVPFTRVKAVFPLFTIRSDGAKVTEINIAGNITIACAIEYPQNSGVYYQFQFSGATSITTTCAAQNGLLVSDWLTIPNGVLAETYFQTRTFIQCAATGAFYGGCYTSSSYSEGTAYSATTPVDASASGTITNGFNFAYGPCALITESTLPCVALSGSSSAYGTGDNQSGDGNGNLGASAKFFWRAGLGHIKLACPGERSAVANASTTWKYRLLLAAMCNPSIVMFHSVSNDIIASGTYTTLADIINGQQNCINLFRSAVPGIRTIGATIQPRTTSTDAWATDVNQTAVAGLTPTGAGLRETWNDYLTAGNTIYNKTVNANASMTESPTRRGAWINSTGGAGPGTANYATTDGIHKTWALHNLAANKLQIDDFWSLT